MYVAYFVIPLYAAIRDLDPSASNLTRVHSLCKTAFGQRHPLFAPPHMDAKKSRVHAPIHP